MAVAVRGKATVVLGKVMIVDLDQGKAAAVQGTPIPKIHRADPGVAAVEVVNSLVVAVRGRARAVAEGPSSKVPASVRCKAGRMEQVSRRTGVVGLEDSNDPTWWIPG
jgi:hypothetical protein